MTKPQACCTVETYIVGSAQLPLSCPMRTERIWDAHPRVYLPIEEKGTVVCPYCGTRYVLESLPEIQSS